MAEGWCKFHRPFLSSPLWLSEPFTRGQAWVDLFALAGHSPSSIRVRGIKIELSRGQIGYSELTLSERWKWSRGKVRRFLRELENDKMLDTRQDNKTTIITILNYDKYQGDDSDNGTTNETASGTPNGHQTDTIKNVKNEKKEEKKNTPLTPRRGECAYSASFEEFWAAYPLRKGKAAAYRAWKSVEKKHPGVKPPQIIAAVKAQVEADTFRSPHDGQLYIPHPATWLNAGRWDDDVKPPGQAEDPLAGLTLEQKFAQARTQQ